MSGHFRLRRASLVFLLTAIAPLALLGRPGPMSADEPAKSDEGFVALFDGKTLAGWEGNEKIFRVDDGAIVGGSLGEKIDRNEFLCSTKQYDDFELRFQARLTGQGDNAGVQFRSQRIPNHHEVIGYQCDIGMAGDKNIWGSLYDESRRRTFLATGPSDELQKSVKKDGWNDLVVRCEGPKIQVWVNGIQTVDYTEKEDQIARKGVIGLQIHSGPPAEAAYRQIRIKELR